MPVAVISKTGERLMPTSEHRARKLLKSGKAIKYSYHPFTIQLTERESGDVQLIELCVDTGYIHIGISVKSEKHEYLAEQIDTLTDEKARHDACRMYRRQRRSRKRYRQPRFNNRKRTLRISFVYTISFIVVYSGLVELILALYRFKYFTFASDIWSVPINTKLFGTE